MAFRTVEITHSSEIHVKAGQMHVEQPEHEEVVIPLEDIAVLICVGANIRLSTMGMSQMVENGIMILTIDESYMPVAMVCPCAENSRQSQVMDRQIHMTDALAADMWKSIVEQKIRNQGRALSILGLSGAETIFSYAESILPGDTGNVEALAAKDYFSFYHPGLNRRTDDPINSCLNYGYAVLRSAITRSLIASGFLASVGLHHHNQLNSFNLSDDVIEPWRPMVDVVAHGIVSSNSRLSKEQRRKLAGVLHNSCFIGNQKTTVLAGIDIMTDSMRKSVLSGTNDIILPMVLPVEETGLITE